MQMASELGRTYESVKLRVKLMGLNSDGVKHGWANNKRDEEYMNRERTRWSVSKRR
jgi:hypothetical protein